jgi:hypothetical protein
VFNENRAPIWKDVTVVTAAQHCACVHYHQTALKIIKMANFVVFILPQYNE